MSDIKESEIIDIELALANNEISLGRETSGLLYSNTSVALVRIVTDFIISKIKTDSLTMTLAKKQDIRKLIKIQDLNPLVMGLIAAFTPNGFDHVRTCKSVVDAPKKETKITYDDEDMSDIENNHTDNVLNCNHIVEAVVDAKKLLWVDKEALTDEQFEHMAKRSPGSTTVDEVIKYQDSLQVNEVKTREVLYKGGVIKFDLKNPFLEKHISVGERWITNVIKSLDKLFTEEMSTEQKNTMIINRSRCNLLSIYEHYIDYITFSNGQGTRDKAAIQNILEIIAGDEEAFAALIDVFYSFIDETTIALVGIPTYICPKCKIKQDTGNDHSGFKEIIPYNALHGFFELSTFITTKLTERTL